MTVHEAKGLALCSASANFKATMVLNNQGLCSVVATPLGKFVNPIQIVSIEAYSLTKVRVTFDRPMLKDSRLVDVDNYLLTPSSLTAAVVLYSEIRTEGVSFPSYVDIVLDSEMTDGESYDIEIETSNGPESPDGMPFSVDTNKGSFLGLGELPQILSVEAVGINRVDVTFTETMTDNEAIRNAANYSFNNGLSVLSVLSMSDDVVKLATSDQVPGTLYTLTIG